MKVLLVEPFEGFKKILESLLKKFTEDIIWTKSIEETLFYLNNLEDENELPLLLITSYILPDGDAIKLFKIIRKNRKFDSIILLMCT